MMLTPDELEADQLAAALVVACLEHDDEAIRVLLDSHEPPSS